MKSDFFIDRPIFSMVISILILIIGVIGLWMLPVDQYPQIVPPVVKVSASYPGASAETVSQAVATPIEQTLNGTPGMIYMESQSTNTGTFSATLTFNIDSNADLAAVEVQNRVKGVDTPAGRSWRRRRAWAFLRRCTNPIRSRGLPCADYRKRWTVSGSTLTRREISLTSRIASCASEILCAVISAR